MQECIESIYGLEEKRKKLMKQVNLSEEALQSLIPV